MIRNYHKGYQKEATKRTKGNEILTRAKQIKTKYRKLCERRFACCGRGCGWKPIHFVDWFTLARCRFGNKSDAVFGFESRFWILALFIFVSSRFLVWQLISLCFRLLICYVIVVIVWKATGRATGKGSHCEYSSTVSRTVVEEFLFGRWKGFSSMWSRGGDVDQTACRQAAGRRQPLEFQC